MISVEEAVARITAGVAAQAPLPAEEVSLAEAFGRVLAEDVAARLTQPPKPMSAMDGWAARAADVAGVPTTLRQVAMVPAGTSYDLPLGPGEAVRLFTGSPVPDGADTIVIQENASLSGDQVEVRESVAAGRHIRRAGLDFAAGQICLSAGRRLTARDIGLAAAMNRPWLNVRRRPRVAILATGDEVVRPGDPVGPNQIVSSNALALAALVAQSGGAPTLLGIAPDEPEGLRRMARGARGFDLFVTTGGASVGDYDLVRGELAPGGLALDFWQVAMRPGKPLMFGHYGDVPMLGLPGNPVSSFVCALLFLRPAIEALLGRPATREQPSTARLARDLPENDRRQDYLRARLTVGADGEPEADPFPTQDSSMMTLLAAADCLVVRRPHAPAASAGSRVEILRLDGS